MQDANRLRHEATSAGASCFAASGGGDSIAGYVAPLGQHLDPFAEGAVTPHLDRDHGAGGIDYAGSGLVRPPHLDDSSRALAVRAVLATIPANPSILDLRRAGRAIDGILMLCIALIAVGLIMLAIGVNYGRKIERQMAQKQADQSTAYTSGQPPF